MKKEKIEEQREKHRARCKKYREKNREKIKIYSREYEMRESTKVSKHERYIRDKNKYIERAREWALNNPNKVHQIHRESSKRYRERHPDKYKEYRINNPEKNRKVLARARENLSSAYIKGLLCKRNNLQHNDIPPQLIEAHRALVQLKRLKKEKERIYESA